MDELVRSWWPAFSCTMLSKAKTTVILFALFALTANAANLRRAPGDKGDVSVLASDDVAAQKEKFAADRAANEATDSASVSGVTVRERGVATVINRHHRRCSSRVLRRLIGATLRCKQGAGARGFAARREAEVTSFAPSPPIPCAQTHACRKEHRPRASHA